MSDSTAANDPNTSLGSAPLVYADTLIGLAIGPFVSKMILGIENPGQNNAPSLQVTMPTNSLHDLAKNILTIMQSSDTLKNIANSHNEFHTAMAKPE